jgi:hypothetical protein
MTMPIRLYDRPPYLPECYWRAQADFPGKYYKFCKDILSVHDILFITQADFPQARLLPP